MKSRSYANSHVLDLESTHVQLIQAEDNQSNSNSRSEELINLVCQMILLAGKRGRVKVVGEGDFREAA